jgi:hypothetical protein
MSRRFPRIAKRTIPRPPTSNQLARQLPLANELRRQPATLIGDKKQRRPAK